MSSADALYADGNHAA
jgi:hypothetical protein